MTSEGWPVSLRSRASQAAGSPGHVMKRTGPSSKNHQPTTGLDFFSGSTASTTHRPEPGGRSSVNPIERPRGSTSRSAIGCAHRVGAAHGPRLMTCSRLARLRKRPEKTTLRPAVSMLQSTVRCATSTTRAQALPDRAQAPPIRTVSGSACSSAAKPRSTFRRSERLASSSGRPGRTPVRTAGRIMGSPRPRPRTLCSTAAGVGGRDRAFRASGRETAESSGSRAQARSSLSAACRRRAWAEGKGASTDPIEANTINAGPTGGTSA